jgi:hypothetical protein
VIVLLDLVADELLVKEVVNNRIMNMSPFKGLRVLIVRIRDLLTSCICKLVKDAFPAGGRQSHDKFAEPADDVSLTDCIINSIILVMEDLSMIRVCESDPGVARETEFLELVLVILTHVCPVVKMAPAP